MNRPRCLGCGLCSGDRFLAFVDNAIAVILGLLADMIALEVLHLGGNFGRRLIGATFGEAGADRDCGWLVVSSCASVCRLCSRNGPSC